MEAWISLLTTLTGAALSIQVGGQYLRRRKPHQLLWAVAIALFAVGAGCQFAGARFGWTAFTYRLWYLTGALLTAAYLGQGTAYLQLKRQTAHILLAILLAGTLAAGVAVFAAPVDLAAGVSGLTATGKGMPLFVRLMTPFFNIYGTVLLAGGALKSSWYFLWSGGSLSRALGTALVAAGAIVVATGGTLTRFNLPGSLYLSELFGLLLIFIGFYFSNRPLPRVTPNPAAITLRRKRVTRWGVWGGVLLLFGLVLSLPILPWTMGIVTNAKHTYIAQLPTENKGAYLMTDQGVMQLFTWYVEPEEFPVDAPVLAAGSVQAVAVVQKQFDQPENYQLYSLTEQRLIAWKSFQTQGTQLILTPGPLAPGEYELVVPTDSMFGGTSEHFFALGQ